jgi:CheY-like chemotaxis protein
MTGEITMKRVLIVEDNVDWRQLLTTIITRLGYAVIAAGTGKEALEQVPITHPDLILMDLGLPEMGGDEATVRIKADPATKHIPIVIQTAFGASASAKRALEAGAAEMMQKPISITDIQKLVVKYLSNGNTISKPDRVCAPTSSASAMRHPAK